MYISSIFTVDKQMSVRDSIESSTSLILNRMGMHYHNASRYGNTYQKVYRGQSFFIIIDVPARYSTAGEFEYENLDDKFDPDCHDSHFYIFPVFDGDTIEYHSGCPASRASINVFNPKGENVTKSRMSRIY